MKRRSFLKNASVSTLSSMLGAEIVFAANLPDSYTPLLLQQADPYQLFGKHQDMVILNDKPWNIEAQAHLLDDEVTPEDKMFIRNNGLIPEIDDTAGWKLTIEGESVVSPKSYSLNTLKTRFSPHTYQLTLECGGNGRSEFNPPAKGNQWTVGAVSCAEWKGVRLKDLLEDTGIKQDAVYVGYYGTDIHLSRDRSKNPISRGIPMAKALQDETLVAYEMNGQPIPLAHGFPLRLVAGGWPASASGKWINRLVVRNKVHDGAKMGGQSYRVPCEPVAPGAEVDDKDMCIIESMPVKSLITFPKSGALLKEKSLDIRGHAWAGEHKISKMYYSADFGASWNECALKPPKNRLAWQRWTATVRFPQKGYYEIWAKAVDDNGQAQPMVLPGWNPRGYLNNACHRIAVKVI